MASCNPRPPPAAVCPPLPVLCPLAHYQAARRLLLPPVPWLDPADGGWPTFHVHTNSKSGGFSVERDFGCPLSYLVAPYDACSPPGYIRDQGGWKCSNDETTSVPTSALSRCGAGWSRATAQQPGLKRDREKGMSVTWPQGGSASQGHWKVCRTETRPSQRSRKAAEEVQILGLAGHAKMVSRGCHWGSSRRPGKSCSSDPSSAIPRHSRCQLSAAFGPG